MKAVNTFYYLTYAGAVDLEVLSAEERVPIEAQSMGRHGAAWGGMGRHGVAWGGIACSHGRNIYIVVDQ